MTGKEENRLEKLLGKAIAERRAALGMSQFDLAERLGIAPASLSRIENGLAAPRFSRLEEIAEILDCPVSAVSYTHLSMSGRKPAGRAPFGGRRPRYRPCIRP